MKHTIRWVVHQNRYRKTGKVQGARQPVEPSDYFKYLCEVGAGWNGRKGSKKNTARLQVDAENSHTRA